MHTEEIHPEIREAIAKVPRLPFGSRLGLPLARLVFDAAAKSDICDGVDVTVATAPGVEVRIYSPKTARSEGAVLWIHGGGHVAGKPEHLNATASMAARDTGATIVAPRYRISPRNPFPADLDDCHKAWCWLVENAGERDLNPDRLAIAGNSAGGGIAAALVQKIHDRGGVQPRAQCLLYPMLDDRVAADKTQDKTNHFIWNNKANRVAWNAYLGRHNVGAKTLPDYVAPARREDLSGLPRAWIGICGIDLFAEEDRVYAGRLRDAGVDCEVYEVDGAPHAFDALQRDADVTKGFKSAAFSFLKKALE